MSDELRAELEKRATDEARIYRMLLQGPVEHNAAFYAAGGRRAPARVHAIKQRLEAEGIGTVVTEKVRGTLWRSRIEWWAPKPARPVHEAEQASLFV